MKKAEPGDLTVLYYTSNYLEDHNPYFLNNCKKQLAKACSDLPIIIISQKQEIAQKWYELGFKDVTLTNMGNIGRSHLNIYRQMLIGAKEAKTKYVALSEDDILYSYDHFHYYVPDGDYFLYDMAKVSLFTWTKPPKFSFRHDRRVVNQLIAPRQYLIDALEERFARFEELVKIEPESEIIKRWGDFGRYEERLGVTVRKTDDFMSTMPSIVFSHEHAFGYLNQGQRKALGSMRIIELDGWGKASDIIKLYDPNL